MKFDRVELISWVSVVFLLSAYFANSVSVLEANSAIYQTLNVLGGAGFIWYGYLRRAWAIVTFNTIWASIAIYSLAKLI